MDETLLPVIATHSGTLRVEAVAKPTSNMKLPKGMHYGSLVHAAGHAPLVVIVLPVKFDNSSSPLTQKSLPPSTGY